MFPRDKVDSPRRTHCLSHFRGARTDKGAQALNVARYYIDNNIVFGLLILVSRVIRYCVMHGLSEFFTHKRSLKCYGAC